MLNKFNVLLILGLSLFDYPLHSKEIYKDKGPLTSTVEELAEEMIHLNTSLDSLTTTVSNLFPGRRLESSF